MPLPSGWEEIKSKSRPGKVYYINKKTGEKTWKKNDIPKGKKEKSKRKEKKRKAPGKYCIYFVSQYSSCLIIEDTRDRALSVDDQALLSGPNKVHVR